jgi:hypothetical protein
VRRTRQSEAKPGGQSGGTLGGGARGLDLCRIAQQKEGKPSGRCLPAHSQRGAADLCLRCCLVALITRITRLLTLPEIKVAGRWLAGL